MVEPTGSNRMPQKLRAMSRMVAGVTAGSGLALTIFWLTVSRPANWFDAIEMGLNTAAALMLLGASLWLAHRERPSVVTSIIGLCVAGIVAVVGILSLAEVASGWDLGVDQVMLASGSSSLLHPGRFPPQTASILACLGASLVLLHAGKDQRWVEVLGGVAFSGSLLGVVSHAYHAQELLGPAVYHRLELQKSAAFLVVAAGVLLARPDQGLFSLLTRDDYGGMMVRRLLPVVILIPLAAGFVEVAGNRAGIYDAEAGTAALVLGLVAILVMVVYVIGHWLSENHRRYVSIADRLRQSEKLEAVGILAGGTSHFFNNLLTIVLGNSEQVMQTLEEHDVRREQLADVSNAVYRASALTKQLFNFAQKSAGSTYSTDVGEAVRLWLTSELGGIPAGVSLALEIPPRPFSAQISPSKFRQLLSILIANATDAMPAGGQLHVRLGLVEHSGPNLASARSDALEGSYVQLQVSDTGRGMSDEVKSHLFEPFFTTKGLAQGTGLGMATLYAIAKQSLGDIHVDSQVGRGTTVSILLPEASPSLSVMSGC
jgi:signal transduction histidine kinase